jgi:hypothetical protein
MRLLVAALVALLLAATSSLADDGPSRKLLMMPPATAAFAPDGKSVLRSVRVADDPALGRAYDLSLSTLANAGATQVLRFHRGVSIAWSADSRAFLLTEHLGSNVSVCHLYRLDRLAYPIDLTAPAYAAVADPRVKQTSHSYVYCLGWLDATRVALELTGHLDGPPGGSFRHSLTYDMASGTMRQND